MNFNFYLRYLELRFIKRNIEKENGYILLDSPRFVKLIKLYFGKSKIRELKLKYKKDVKDTKIIFSKIDNLLK
jgi:hypothetical protein